ncbi:MAG: TetR/AcrR family transcriptional regulator [Clostridia bacterium]|nr:TetR/AcrR family transcriptional regulator [Clostridia bacterium]
MKGKRELILQSVLDIMMENGVNGLKVSDIAKRADIGKGTVYEYFPSKEDLFLGAVEFGLDMCVAHISESVSGKSGFNDSLQAFIDSIIEITGKAPFLSMIGDSSNMPFTGNAIKRLRATAMGIMEAMTDILDGIISKGAAGGIVKKPENPLYIQSLVITISNMIMHNAQAGGRSRDDLSAFFHEYCLKLLS